jgi:hypothetical protein
MQDYDKISVLYVSHKKKSFTKYRWRTYSRWQIALILIVSSSGVALVLICKIMTNVISVPAEEHNRYMIYITTYPPSGARVFNDVWTALHTFRECFHVLWKRPQDIHRSPRPRCAIMTSHTINTQPLPHNRDCPQVNLILWG